MGPSNVTAQSRKRVTEPSRAPALAHDLAGPQGGQNQALTVFWQRDGDRAAREQEHTVLLLVLRDQGLVDLEQA